jgi:hypothetical protein
MISFSRVVLMMVLIVFLLAGASPSWPMMVVGQKPTEGAKGEGVKKSTEMKKAPDGANSVRIVTGFVKGIEDGVLYTEIGQYSLAGVKVSDLTKDRKKTSSSKVPKKTAEMVFFNDRLQEVIIRQR